MEHLFGTLKSEWFDGQRYSSREQAKQDVIHFIGMEYNSDRDHLTLRLSNAEGNRVGRCCLNQCPF